MFVLVLNGPNLNVLGKRQPSIYGKQTLQDLENQIITYASANQINVTCLQSNSEGEIINFIQEARDKYKGIIIYPAGYTHTSIAILDALKYAEVPVIEVHITNIFHANTHENSSLTALGCTGVICGLGFQGYILALEALREIM